MPCRSVGDAGVGPRARSGADVILVGDGSAGRLLRFPRRRPHRRQTCAAIHRLPGNDGSGYLPPGDGQNVRTSQYIRRKWVHSGF